MRRSSTGSWTRSALIATSLAASLEFCLAALAPARAQTEVDLALVIAVDISYSMDPDEQLLQREGFIQAFRSPEVHAAIRRGTIGRIGVVYVEWAGAQDQQVVLPWTVIDGAAAATAFAASLSQKPTRRASRTSISGAIEFSAKLLAASELQASRQVIDISGDGPNNAGRPVTAARDDAVERGITVNGLPIMLKEGGVFDLADLDAYYRACVIGGPGSFLVPVRSREQFVAAVKTKIIMEVAALPSPGRAPPEQGGGLVVPVQRQGAPVNCLIGEMQWRERMGN
ncbi:DUF1194 domain-containing protein [Enterovirga rhinocerotis]|uniref:Uncharacterized protein DUF1194 n=1 Tax=Enterovirga rhinocerotis TaxID=1339210 RepID=A0A4V3DX57_9HYPH|nr:DUF1194 domain-containing protein [Enterovirga rhinocerotis]TDR87219.1 uncharacterized protein DUF1194 [Enterovirga rhinocerotis]